MTMQLTRGRGVLIVALLAVALYASSLLNMFAYDDVAVIPNDTRVHSLANIPKIFATSYWNNEAQALYRPLITTSFAVDWAVATNHPGWFHAMNVLWNAAVSILAFLLLAELFPIAAALAGAIIFVAHPVHVESVANIVGRAELMAATFALGAALTWVRSRDRFALLFTAPALFLLALLCKESAIMLPPLLVLLDLATGRLQLNRFTAWLRDRAPAMAALAVAAFAYLLQRSTVLPNLTPTSIDAALEVVPHGMPRIMTAMQVWPTYLRLLVFPRTLLADYGPRVLMPQTSVSPMVIIGFTILVTSVVGGMLAAWRGYGRTALALLWVPIAMLPVSNLFFPIGIIVAERTLFLPSFAIAIGVAGAVAWAASPEGDARLRAWRGTSPLAERSQPSRLVWIAVIIVLAAGSVRTLLRIPDWRTTQSIFRAQARNAPDSFRAHWHFARKAAQANNPQQALQSYGVALQLWPYRKRLLREASDYAARHGDLPFAMRISEQGTRAWPLDVDFHRSVAGIALDMGDSARAAASVTQGLKLAPADKVLNDMRATLGHWMKRP